MMLPYHQGPAQRCADPHAAMPQEATGCVQAMRGRYRYCLLDLTLICPQLSQKLGLHRVASCPCGQILHSCTRPCRHSIILPPFTILAAIYALKPSVLMHVLCHQCVTCLPSQPELGPEWHEAQSILSGSADNRLTLQGTGAPWRRQGYTLHAGITWYLFLCVFGRAANSLALP